MITLDMQRAFEHACDTVLNIPSADGKSIGEFAEKTVHAVLKNYYAPDTSWHEVKRCGFVADIYTGSEIIEIQTRQFFRMKRKLDAFLIEDEVTIVFPVAHSKWLRWVNPESGEISKPRKSPRRGSKYSIFPELYSIKEYLENPRLHFKIVLMDIEEYKLLNGWSKDGKRGASRNDGIPTALIDEVSLHSPSDYRVFLPDGLPDSFTVKIFARAASISVRLAGISLNILHHLGLVSRIGKKGNAFIYAIKKTD